MVRNLAAREEAATGRSLVATGGRGIIERRPRRRGFAAIEKEPAVPAYEYRCLDCRQDFTVFLTLEELDSQPLHRCPHCQSDHTERKFGAFFVKTDKKS